jgi:uncharacterized protein YutE (UPF0331/DUF86 family)
MKDQRIEEFLQRLNGYLANLNKYAAIAENDFIEDETIIAAAERYLQLAIETCLNIGNRIISVEQYQKKINIPENYSDIFKTLVSLNIIDRNKLDNFINMTGFRNRLVHMYWDIDPKLLYQYLNENLKDFNYFAKCVIEYLNS